MWYLILSLLFLSFILFWTSHVYDVVNKEIQQNLKHNGYATYKTCKVVKMKNLYLIVDSSKEEQCF